MPFYQPFNLVSKIPLQSRCLSAKVFVVWIEGVVGTASFLALPPLDGGCNCVAAKGGRWSSRAVKDIAVALVTVVVVVGGRGGSRSSNEGGNRDIEGVSSGVTRELIRPSVLNLISMQCRFMGSPPKKFRFYLGKFSQMCEPTPGFL